MIVKIEQLQSGKPTRTAVVRFTAFVDPRPTLRLMDSSRSIEAQLHIPGARTSRRGVNAPQEQRWRERQTIPTLKG